MLHPRSHQGSPVHPCGKLVFIIFTLLQLLEKFYRDACVLTGLPWLLRGKESTFRAGDTSGTGDTGSVLGSGRSPAEGNGNSLQNSCLGNPTEEPGRLQSMGLQKSKTWLSDRTNQHILTMPWESKKENKTIWAIVTCFLLILIVSWGSFFLDSECWAIIECELSTVTLKIYGFFD